MIATVVVFILAYRTYKIMFMQVPIGPGRYYLKNKRTKAYPRGSFPLYCNGTLR